MRLLPIPLVALILVLGSCTSTPRPRPKPVPRPMPVAQPLPPVPAPLASDWNDWPYTPGDWVYRRDARGSIAVFGMPGADASFTIRCDSAAGAIYLSRAATAAPATATPMTIRTTTATRTLAAQPTGGTPPYLAVALQPRDGLLEAIGFSRGRFVVQQPALPALVIPTWAEIGRVIEDCRR